MLPTIRILALALAVAALATGPARAETLHEALRKAIITSHALGAADERALAAAEGIDRAWSGFRPQVSLAGEADRQFTRSRSETGDSATQTIDSATVELNVSQRLFDGGRVFAQVRQAEAQTETERARLALQEQEVLLTGVTAYMDVLRAGSILDYTRRYTEVIGELAAATERRFELQEATVTDVAQARNRLAAARATQVDAENSLLGARAAYIRIIGAPPADLESPETLPALPETLDTALGIALEESHLLAIVGTQADSVAAQLDAAEADLLPLLQVQGFLGHDRFGGDTTIDQRTNYGAGLQLNVPLYAGGATRARIRQLKHSVSQVSLEVLEEREVVQQTVINTWDSLATSLTRRTVIDEQLAEAQTALDSLRREYVAGTRLLIDVLDGEFDVLQAQTALARTERDVVVLTYRLLGAIGRLSVDRLDLMAAEATSG